MSLSRTVAHQALRTVLLAALVAWLLFVGARYADVWMYADQPSFGFTESGASELMLVSRYLTFAAVIVLSAGSLFAKRRLLGRDASKPSTLTRPVNRFTNLVMIISLVLAAVAALGIFMSSFFDGYDAGEMLGPAHRILYVYLPILLYTALVVTVLLVGFVFARPNSARGADHEDERQLDDNAAHASPLATAPTEIAAMPAPSVGDGDARRGQRLVALSFVIPIIAVATALILGLIVFDLTQSSPEVWVWVVIQTLIAAGIVAGTVCATKALTSHTRAATAAATPSSTARTPVGAAGGAKILNFVLSVIFAVAVMIMSLSFAASAVGQLHIQPFLTLNIEPAQQVVVEEDEWTPVTNMSIFVDGSGLAANSFVTVTTESLATPLIEESTDRDGYLYADVEFDADFAEGAHPIIARAVSADGTQVTAELAITLNDETGVAFPEGTSSAFAEDSSHLAPVTLSWIVGSLLPAGLLFLLVVASIYATLTLRNREVQRG